MAQLSDFDVKWKKVSGGSGLAGTWEQVDMEFTEPDEWEIEPYQGTDSLQKAWGSI